MCLFTSHTFDIHIQKLRGKRYSEPDGSLPTIEHTGIAVPALFRIADFRHSEALIELDHINGTYLGASTATDTLFFINNRRHGFLLAECVVQQTNSALVAPGQNRFARNFLNLKKLVVVQRVGEGKIHPHMLSAAFSSFSAAEHDKFPDLHEIENLKAAHEIMRIGAGQNVAGLFAQASEINKSGLEHVFAADFKSGIIVHDLS